MRFRLSGMQLAIASSVFTIMLIFSNVTTSLLTDHGIRNVLIKVPLIIFFMIVSLGMSTMINWRKN